jgi:cation-transporting ATPase 13A3/4/5
MIAPCDMIVLNGQVVMNEAMLTGESIPVTKSPLPFNNFNYASNEDGKQSTILAGTLCIETKIAGKGRIPVIAVVT